MIETMLKILGLRKYVLFAFLVIPIPPVQEFTELETGLLALKEGRLTEALAALDRQKLRCVLSSHGQPFRRDGHGHRLWRR